MTFFQSRRETVRRPLDLLHDSLLVFVGGRWNGERFQSLEVDRSEVRRLLTHLLEPALPKTVSVHRDELRVEVVIEQSGSEDMVLVDAVVNLSFPNPASPGSCPGRLLR